ncbi:hypothetical protein IHQ71_27850 [Rhizobium sp. TH2]|uniref:hypothetical protein n=1 Tax=Rhizobium sp. TH2 TaxID=2775403 RepID=UPI002157B51C|nr:hypothetical protein [Rhizobium sp. TH2]UVC08883.1 hypothetical protein IHQ71_27850 [Rhizobium sp. TH2]
MLRGRFVWAAILIAFVACSGLARAQTLSYADAVTKLADDCGADIKKLCKGLNLGGGRIASCLQEKSAKVSSTCKGTIAVVFSSIGTRQQAQASYKKICKGDIARRCKGIKGDGYVLACLNKPNKHISDECAQTMTDAGWR